MQFQTYRKVAGRMQGAPVFLHLSLFCYTYFSIFPSLSLINVFMYIKSFFPGHLFKWKFRISRPFSNSFHVHCLKIRILNSGNLMLLYHYDLSLVYIQVSSLVSIMALRAIPRSNPVIRSSCLLVSFNLK